MLVKRLLALLFIWPFVAMISFISLIALAAIGSVALVFFVFLTLLGFLELEIAKVDLLFNRVLRGKVDSGWNLGKGDLLSGVWMLFLQKGKAVWSFVWMVNKAFFVSGEVK